MSDLSLLTADTVVPSKLGKFLLEDVSQKADWTNLLIYGDSGVGKTVLAGSASVVPEMSPVLCIDIEGGTLSLRKRYPNVKVVRPKDWKSFNELYELLYDGKHPFKTVIIDSTSEAQPFSMSGIMQKLHIQDQSRDPDLPGIGEWGKNTNQMRTMIRAFRDLEMHTIFTALMMEEKNPRTGVVSKKPKMTSKLANDIPGLVDEVLYYYVKAIKNKGEKGTAQFQRLLLTTKTEETVAKDRSDNLPEVMMNPTMDQIYSYLTHKKQRENYNPLDPEQVNENGIEA